MFECQGWGGGGDGYFSFNPPTTPSPKFKVIFMIPWHLCLSVWGGGGVGVLKKWEKFLQIQKLNVEHPPKI